VCEEINECQVFVPAASYKVDLVGCERVIIITCTEAVSVVTREDHPATGNVVFEPLLSIHVLDEVGHVSYQEGQRINIRVTLGSLHANDSLVFLKFHSKPTISILVAFKDHERCFILVKELKPF